MKYTALRASAKNQGLIFRALDKPDPNLIQATLKKKKLLLTLYIYIYIGQNGPLASILEIFGPKTLFAK